MMGVALGLTVAYVAVAALLLHLSLATRWSTAVKIGGVLAVTGLYAVAWHGHKGLLGWASPEPLPSSFRVHWVTIDDPDPRTGDPGAIYFWVRTLDEAGQPQGAPRAHTMPWDEATAEAAQEALTRIEGGELLNGQLTRQLVRPTPPDAAAPPEAPGGPASPTDGPPELEFTRAPPPTLPAKPAPPGTR